MPFRAVFGGSTPTRPAGRRHLSIGWRVAAAAALAALSYGGCTLLSEAEIGAGLGGKCEEDTDCQGSTCQDGVCTIECSSDSDCPDPARCQADGLCAVPMHATFLYVGVTEDLGWSYVHDEARKATMSRLPWLTTDFQINLFTDDLVRDAGQKAIDDGAHVVIHTAQGNTSVMKDLAAKNPDVKFLQLFDTVVQKPNLGAYWLKIHQAWYVAGAVAARRSQTGRIAFIGGYVSPQGVIRANGYIRGAQSVDPNIKVEVRWLGFWFDANPEHDEFDEKLEVQLANRAIDSGCDVVMANLDNELSYEAVERRRVEEGEEVWSIATNNPTACDKYPNTCLGVAALNWTSIYTEQLDAMHKGTWEPTYVHAPMVLDQGQSPVAFIPYAPNTAVDTSLAIGNLVGRIVADPDLVLRGPYDSTGQRPGIGNGEAISDDELLHMCWFPKGAVERADAEDPESLDVDAIVPDGSRLLLSGDSPDCRANQNQ